MALAWMGSMQRNLSSHSAHPLQGLFSYRLSLSRIRAFPKCSANSFVDGMRSMLWKLELELQRGSTMASVQNDIHLFLSLSSYSYSSSSILS